MDRYSIRPLTISELPLVEARLFSGGMPDKHVRNFARQERGFCTYLFAWEGDVPVGHVLIRWIGSEHEPVKSVRACSPEIGALFVRQDRRRRGIGDSLMQYAEGLVGSRGINEIGLAVGI